MPGILSLDLSMTRVGWAHWSPNQLVSHGSFKIADSSFCDGYRIESYRRKLADLYKIHDPELISYEQPFFQASTGNTVVPLFFLIGMTQWFATQVNIPARLVYNQSWRAHFLKGIQRPKGLSKKDAREVLKEISIEACERHGWSPANDDEADALGILAYTAATESKWTGITEWGSI